LFKTKRRRQLALRQRLGTNFSVGAKLHLKTPPQGVNAYDEKF
jgi:hypothetical protein